MGTVGALIQNSRQRREWIHAAYVLGWDRHGVIPKRHIPRVFEKGRVYLQRLDLIEQSRHLRADIRRIAAGLEKAADIWGVGSLEIEIYAGGQDDDDADYDVWFFG